MKLHKILSAVALAGLLLAGSGCKKYAFRDGQIRFTATSDALQTRTAYSGEVFSGMERIDWVDGDKIAIAMVNAGGVEICDYQITSITDAYAKSTAQLANVAGNGLQWGEGEHTFFAVYPSPSVDDEWENSLTEEGSTLVWPATQQVTADPSHAGVYLPDMKYAYMAASASVDGPEENVSLSFVPMFNAYEISIGAGDNDRIDLTGFRLICNRDDIPLSCKQVSDFDRDVLSDEGGIISVDLTGVSLTRDGGPITFTVFTFPDENEEMTLEFTGTQIGTRTLDLKRDGEWIAFSGNKKHRISGLAFPRLDNGSVGGQGINWNGTVSEDLNWNGAEGEDINWGGNRPYILPGQFSVSATKKVQFSRGNLVYKAGEWDFHKQQYDRCFKENCSANFNSGSTFDLFGWATAGIAAADNTMVNYQPWIFNFTPVTGQESTNPYGHGPSIENVPRGTSWDEYAEYCDWGSNYGVIQKAGAGWHTLSVAEWTYLFTLRSASEVNGVSNARFAKARVHGMPGLLIFPDTFGADYAGNQSVFTAGSINQMDASASDFSDIVLSGSVWGEAEAAGAVFLPASGLVFMGSVIASVDPGVNVYYWTSTASTSVNSAVYVGASSGVVLDVRQDYLYVSGYDVLRGAGCAVRLAKTVE